MTRGLFALLAFALLSAARDVLTKQEFLHTGNIDAITVTFVFCASTWLCFFLLSLFTRHGRGQIVELRRALTDRRAPTIALLNVATLIAYMTSFMAIAKTDAFVNALADYGAAPVVTAVLALAMRGERFSRTEILGMFLSVCGIAILVGSRDNGNPSSTAVGVGLALISCIALGLANIWNKTLVDAGVRRGTVIMSRLLLAILVLGLWCAHTGSLVSLDWGHDGWRLAVIGVLGMAIPLYLVVVAFEVLGVRYLALAFFLIPVFTFVGTSLMASKFDGLGLLATALTLSGVYIAERAASRRTRASASILDSDSKPVERVTSA